MDSVEMLRYVLEGQKISSNQLEDFIAENKEGQLLDYKDGKLLNRDKKRAIMTVRKYVNAFANSEGGLLIIGVDDIDRKISPCPNKMGQQSLDEWSSSVVQDMAPYLSPPPRFQEVNHSNGLVLVIGVSRAPQITPCVESKSLKYFLRIHDKTVEAPDFLISDLIIGHRQQPDINVSLGRHLSWSSRQQELPINAVNIKFSLRVENVGLICVENVKVGMLSWSLAKKKGIKRYLNSSLQSYIDIEESFSGDFRDYYSVSHKLDLVNQRLHPFDISGHLEFEFSYAANCSIKEVFTAIYVLSTSGRPTLFQFIFDIPACVCSEGYGRFSPESTENWKISRAMNVRPRICLVGSSAAKTA